MSDKNLGELLRQFAIERVLHELEHVEPVERVLRTTLFVVERELRTLPPAHFEVERRGTVWTITSDILRDGAATVTVKVIPADELPPGHIQTPVFTKYVIVVYVYKAHVEHLVMRPMANLDGLIDQLRTDLAYRLRSMLGPHIAELT